MLDKVFTNNQVTIAGEVVSDFTFSHEIYGENFFLVNIAVSRLSDSCDIIPVMVSDRLMDVKGDYKGCILQASGQFRSYNRHEETKNRLVLSVFANIVFAIISFTLIIIVTIIICKKNHISANH